MKSTFILFLSIILSSYLHSRTWTSKSGSKLEADLMAIQDDKIKLRKKDYKTILIKINQLSESDQKFIENSSFAEKDFFATEKGVILVLESKGEVSISDGNIEIFTENGKPFSEGAIITTGSTGKISLLLSNGTTMTVFNNTKIHIEEFLQETANNQFEGTIAELKREPSSSRTRLKLNYGQLYSNIKKLNNSSMMTYETNQGTAGIRGTEILLQSDPDLEALNFAVMNGMAEFSNSQDPITLVDHNTLLKVKEGSFTKGDSPEDISQIMQTSEKSLSKLSSKFSNEDIQSAFEIAQPATINYGENILENGGFEKKLRGWEIIPNNKKTNAEKSNSKLKALEGDRYLHLVSSDAPKGPPPRPGKGGKPGRPGRPTQPILPPDLNNTSRVQTLFEVPHAGTYEFSFSIRREDELSDSFNLFQAEVLEGRGVRLNASEIQSHWTTHSETYDLPENIDRPFRLSLNVVLKPDSKNEDDIIHIDNVQIREVLK